MSKATKEVFVKGDRVTWEGTIRHGYRRAGDEYTGTGIITKIYESCIGGKRVPVMCAKIQIDESCVYPLLHAADLLLLRRGGAAQSRRG